MRLDGIKSGLVWVGLTCGVSGAIALGNWDGAGMSTSRPPGHEAALCGACRAHEDTRGPSLPYELGDDNIRFTYPTVRVEDSQALGN